MSQLQRYDLPEVADVRQRIEGIPDEKVKLCVKAMFLFCARVCEVVGVASASDTTTPYGPKGTDFFMDVYRFPPAHPVIEEPCAVFKVRTAKKEGMLRHVALPLNPKYEPWARPLLDYFKSRGDRHVFPFTRQTVYNYTKVAFAGFTYPIEKYAVFTTGISDTRERHQKEASNHFLRHLRASDLVAFYSFTPEEQQTFGGWLLARIPESQRRYNYLNWKMYFAKLLVERF